MNKNHPLIVSLVISVTIVFSSIPALASDPVSLLTGSLIPEPHSIVPLGGGEGVSPQGIKGFVLTGVSCIYLVILGLLGPLVFAISMIPNFQSSMWQWLARYIQISLWTPIVYIVQFANMKLTDACASTYLGTVSSVTNIPLLTFIVLNLIAIVAMFSVPSIAGWVIQSTGANNVQRGLSQGATYIVMAVSKFL